MHFYKHKGKQVLDMRGNLVLSRRGDDFITAFPASARPRRVLFARYIPNINKLGFFAKIKATITCINFIWFEDNTSVPEPIEDK